MKAKIHPADNEIRVMGACGNSFTTRSTHKGDIHLEICSNCHPFFTGKQKLLDTAGRVERFRRKYAKADAMKADAATKATANQPAIQVVNRDHRQRKLEERCKQRLGWEHELAVIEHHRTGMRDETS